MAKHLGGETVAAGFYMNVAEWNVETYSGNGGVLPGNADVVYRSVPVVVLLIAVLLLGAAFAMFLPFIGFAMVIGLFAKRTAQAVQRTGVELAALVHPGWRPGEAYLAGKRPAKDGAPEKKNDELDALAREIEAKRNKK